MRPLAVSVNVIQENKRSTYSVLSVLICMVWHTRLYATNTSWRIHINEILYDIGPIRSSTKNIDTQLNVYVTNKRFKIDLFTANFESSPALLIEYLRHVQSQDPAFIPDSGRRWRVRSPLDEIHHWIFQPFLSVFCKQPPLEQSQKRWLGYRKHHEIG